jgi:nucleotide-binding universal stress UspA family protein
MFETVVIATDGSESAGRAVRMALDLADRFDAAVHALYVVDAGELRASPEDYRATLEEALEAAGGEALWFVEEEAAAEAAGCEVVTAVREGDPADEIVAHAEAVGADVIATGTRGRHGDHAFLLGSVAEAVVRRSPVPVLTVRQLGTDEGPVSSD